MPNWTAALAALLLAAPAVAQTGPSAPADKAQMATPSQQKPAEEKQQNVPGPTPQETSGKTDSHNFTGKETTAAPQPSAGSSQPPK